MALGAGDDADEVEWTEQRFLNPVGENESMNDSAARLPDDSDPEKFPTILSQLPNTLRTSNGDGIVTALGRPISVPELVRLTKLSSCVIEKKDVNGLVYRLELNTTEDGRNYLYRFGLLEDGNAWKLMSKAELFNVNSPCAVSYSRCCRQYNANDTAIYHAQGSLFANSCNPGAAEQDV